MNSSLEKQRQVAKPPPLKLQQSNLLETIISNLYCTLLHNIKKNILPHQSPKALELLSV